MTTHPVWPERPALFVAMGADHHLHVGRNARIRIPAQPARFAIRVIDDLARLDETADGVAVIDACDASPHVIVITEPESPIDPPNGLIYPTEQDAATRAGRPYMRQQSGGLLGTGAGSDSRISYDPAIWPWVGDPSSPPGHQVLLALLRQALVYARGEDDPLDGQTCDRRTA